MIPSSDELREHLLLYEPRTEGHHLGWLRFITEDFLSAGLRLTLAVDQRPDAQEKVRDHLAELRSEVTLIQACHPAGRRHWDGRSRSVTFCLEQSGAANVFLCAFDEIASQCWRRAAVGLYPPEGLHGRMGGIYHRPRFMVAPWWSPNRWLKQSGFRRLVRGGWLRQLLFVDEYLARDRQAEFPGAPFCFLPDPCPPGYDGDAAEARRQLGVPQDRRVFLFYGGGYRRKGLHLAVEAMRQLPAEVPAFLLCAGQLNPEGSVAAGLQQLTAAGCARLINRYVSTTEEKLAFAASDAVLLPYVHHFGTSGVLSRAMSAGKPVIVSDEQLLGRLTRRHGLGLLFPSTSVPGLRQCLLDATRMPAAQWAAFVEAARRYATVYSREAYRAALLRSVGRREA